MLSELQFSTSEWDPRYTTRQHMTIRYKTIFGYSNIVWQFNKIEMVYRENSRSIALWAANV